MMSVEAPNALAEFVSQQALGHARAAIDQKGEAVVAHEAGGAIALGVHLRAASVKQGQFHTSISDDRACRQMIRGTDVPRRQGSDLAVEIGGKPVVSQARHPVIR